MDSDDALRAAVLDGAVFALVRVHAVARDKAGTRSQTAVYDCEVVRTIDNALSSPITLKHFGVPILEVGHHYVVGAVDSRRHHGAWELRFATDAADVEQSVAAFLSRRADLIR
jgi:hypothetical protein